MTILHRDRLRAMAEWFDVDQFDELRSKLDRAPAIDAATLSEQLRELSTKLDTLFHGEPTDELATEVSEAAYEMSAEILEYTDAIEKIYHVLERLTDLAVDADSLDEDPVRPEDSENPIQEDWTV